MAGVSTGRALILCNDCQKELSTGGAVCVDSGTDLPLFPSGEHIIDPAMGRLHPHEHTSIEPAARLR